MCPPGVPVVVRRRAGRRAVQCCDAVTRPRRSSRAALSEISVNNGAHLDLFRGTQIAGRSLRHEDDIVGECQCPLDVLLHEHDGRPTDGELSYGFEYLARRRSAPTRGIARRAAGTPPWSQRPTIVPASAAHPRKACLRSVFAVGPARERRYMPSQGPSRLVPRM